MKNFLGKMTTDFFVGVLRRRRHLPESAEVAQRPAKGNSKSRRPAAVGNFARKSRPRGAGSKSLFEFAQGYSFRIYFLIYRLRSFFLSLKITDPRKESCVLLSSASGSDDYSLTIIQKFIRLKISGERVDGFKQYLKYWESRRMPR